jgi:pimeloyl-ACP methyl ester carboxylesterase
LLFRANFVFRVFVRRAHGFVFRIPADFFIFKEMWTNPKYISVNGTKIAYHDSGAGHSETAAEKPVLFFVHGLGLTHLFWKYAVQHLQNEYRCIAIDLPGHGDSWEARGNFSMSFYASAVRGCIEEMQLKDITLVGHSMGGQISVIAALQLQAVIGKLVLVCPAGIEKFTEEEGQKIIAGAEFLYKSQGDINQIVNTYAQHFSMHAERVRELADDHILQNTERSALFNEMVIASVKGMLKEPVSAFLSHLHQPVLVINGEKDLLIPNRWVHPTMTIFDVEEIAKKKIVNSKTKMVPLCGHYLPFEQPGIFAEMVKEFWVSSVN